MLHKTQFRLVAKQRREPGPLEQLVQTTQGHLPLGSQLQWLFRLAGILRRDLFKKSLGIFEPGHFAGISSN